MQQNKKFDAQSFFCCALLLFSSFGLPRAEAAARKPPSVPRESHYLMGALGDSISAATFADTAIQIDGTEILDSPFQSILYGEAKASLLFENKETLSWASGNRINSHFTKLRRLLEGDTPSLKLSVQNFAIPGAVANGVPNQAKELAKAMSSGQYASLHYVTLLIGANDACSSETEGGTPNEKMIEELKLTFRILSGIQQKEPIRVLLSSIPNIPMLGRPEISNLKTVLNLTCHYLRGTILRPCNPLVEWESPEELKRKINYVREKNELLRAAAQEANREYPGLNVHFSEALFAQNISASILAADCFHPNSEGQEEISRVLWEEQPWFH